MLEDTLEVLSLIGLVSSSIFMIELLASVWAFGFMYVRNPFAGKPLHSNCRLDILDHGFIASMRSLSSLASRSMLGLKEGFWRKPRH